MGSGGGGSVFRPRKDPVREMAEKIVSKTVNWVKDKVFGGSSSSAGRSASREDSYDPDKARLEETLRINNILTEFRTSVEAKSDKFEKEVLSTAREALDDLVAYLTNINEEEYGGRKLHLNLTKIQRENRKTEDLIHGYIKKQAQKRVSLDDSECLRILKMPAGQEKEIEMTKFADSVLNDAVMELSEMVKKSMKEQCDNLSDQIQDRIEGVTFLVNEKLSKAKEIEALKAKDELSLQNEQVKMGYFIAVADLGIKQVD